MNEDKAINWTRVIRGMISITALEEAHKMGLIDAETLALRLAELTKKEKQN